MRTVKVKDTTFDKILTGKNDIYHGYSENKKYKSLMNEKEIYIINESRTKSIVKKIIRMSIENIEGKKLYKIQLI